MGMVIKMLCKRTCQVISSKRGWEVVHLVQYIGMWKGQMLSIRWKIPHTEQLQILFFHLQGRVFPVQVNSAMFQTIKTPLYLLCEGKK